MRQLGVIEPVTPVVHRQWMLPAYSARLVPGEAGPYYVHGEHEFEHCAAEIPYQEGLIPSCNATRVSSCLVVPLCGLSACTAYLGIALLDRILKNPKAFYRRPFNQNEVTTFRTTTSLSTSEHEVQPNITSSICLGKLTWALKGLYEVLNVLEHFYAPICVRVIAATPYVEVNSRAWSQQSFRFHLQKDCLPIVGKYCIERIERHDDIL